jgi:hypothetical protein
MSSWRTGRLPRQSRRPPRHAEEGLFISPRIDTHTRHDDAVVRAAAAARHTWWVVLRTCGAVVVSCVCVYVCVWVCWVLLCRLFRAVCVSAVCVLPQHVHVCVCVFAVRSCARRACTLVRLPCVCRRGRACVSALPQAAAHAAAMPVTWRPCRSTARWLLCVVYGHSPPLPNRS